MRNRVICHLCLAGIMLYLAAGCETTFEQKGRDVKFTASSRGSVSTKTAYGDETTDGYAIIMWEDNDRIRIYSPNTAYLIGSEGSAEVVGAGDGQTEYPVVYDDYTLAPGDITGHIHNATLKNVGVSDNENPDGRGLYWNVSEGQANFYSAYPTDVGIGWYEGGLTFELKIPNDQDPFAETPKPQFNTLPLLAMQSGVSSGQKVNLEFYPAFTAFEFNLKSEDLITLNSFTLETSGDNCYVTGTCFYNPALTKKTGDNFYIKNDQIYFVAPIPEFPNYWADTSYELCEKSLTINFPTGTQIGPAVGETPAKEVTFTLFALPNDLDQMSITVNLTTTDGSTKSRKLKLQQKETSDGPYEWITFPAGHKAKIIGLAVDGGSKWKLNIKADVLDWTFYDEPLSSLNQINVNPIDDDNHTVKVTGSIETTAKWLADHPDTGSNHELPNDVPEDDPSYYARYYQVRTLNWSQAPEKQFFEMSFTPTAPIGGYWQMIPEYPDQSSVGHFRFEVKIEDLTGWEEQDVPHAQIIDKRVFIRIYPVYENDDDHIYEMTLKCYFSPNKSFDPTYSADSELQDVHRKGDFSYWRFRLERYAGGPYTVSTADEHESLKPRN